MKIVVLDAKTVTNGDVSLDFFSKYGDVEIHSLNSAEQTAERLADADMVIVNKTVINEAVMRQAKKLKYIGLFATGYNNIDVEYASAHGITVCNAGSYSTSAVTQQVFAFILEKTNRTADYNRFVSEGGWKKSDTFSPFVFTINELAGKTLGIVGYGSIGSNTAAVARAFGMKVLVYTRTHREDAGVEFVGLDELLGESDFVTVHCPLNKESEHMFDREAFSKMKKSAYFINTARGGVVDEKALREALENEVIAGAAVDVLTQEPMREDCELFDVKNLTVTPHIAWAPIETRNRLMGIVESNIKNFIDGHPTNVVK